MQCFSQKGEELYVINALLTPKTFLVMKKMLLIVAVAFAAISCGNKAEQKCEGQCCQDSAAVEVVEAEAVEAEAVEAPAEAVEAPVAE